jgi:hypothetical protein
VKALLLFVLLSIAAYPAAAQEAAATAAQDAAAAAAPATRQDASAKKIDPAKEAAIRKLFEVQGTAKLMQQVIASMSTSMRPMLMNSLPPGEYRSKLIDLFFEKFQSKIQVGMLVDLAIPVYDKYFSKDEIERLTQFYQTPLGQKFLSVQPKVISETQAESMKIGQDIGRQAMLDVFEEHPEMKKALEEAAAAAQK